MFVQLVASGSRLNAKKAVVWLTPPLRMELPHCQPKKTHPYFCLFPPNPCGGGLALHAETRDLGSGTRYEVLGLRDY